MEQVVKPPVLVIGTREYEFDTRYAVSTPDSVRLNADGFRQIREYLTLSGVPAVLPNDFNPTWVLKDADENGYRGKFPQRVRAFYWKQHQYKLPDKILDGIGTLGSQYLSGSSRLPMDIAFYEFVKHFDWRAGDFGDNGSCWWGSRAYGQSRESLEKADGAAIRWYTTAGRGVSRAWILVPEEGTIVMFNSPTPSFQTMDMARVLASFEGLAFGRCSLSTSDYVSRRSYVNSGSQVVVGRESTVRQIESRGFVWAIKNDPSVPKPGHRRCANCNEWHPIDTLSDLRNNGGLWCPSCIQAILFLCEGCSEYHHTSDQHDTDHGTFCTDCYREKFPRCAECHRRSYGEEYTTVSDGTRVCSRCLEDRYFQCHYCEDFVPNARRAEHVTTEDHDICTGCAQAHFTLCAVCLKYEFDEDVPDMEHTHPVCAECDDRLVDCVICHEKRAEPDAAHQECKFCVTKMMSPSNYDRTLLWEEGDALSLPIQSVVSYLKGDTNGVRSESTA